MGSVLKNLGIAVLLVAVIYFGYTMFFAADSELMIDSGGGEGQLVASEFLMKLNELQSIDFSSDIFSDRRFNSFTSFSTLPEAANAGRDNPFSF